MSQAIIDAILTSPALRRTIQEQLDKHNKPVQLSTKKRLTADDVKFVVNDIGEFGVKVGNQFFFMDVDGACFTYDSEGPANYRPVEPREFPAVSPDLANCASFDEFRSASNTWQSMTPTRACRKAGTRSLHEYQAVYGSKLVASIDHACKALVTTRHSMIRATPGLSRPYSSKSSGLEVARWLVLGSPELAGYSASTVRAVLPLFVSCPRGRPSRKTK